MALSKSTRIWLLLGINTIFFLLELVIGSAVHSLALVADSFHMLNDVLSLFVGLWAVKVATHSSSKSYTYGWQRAETLGALINGVFLVALCVTIFLEAIQRFVEPPTISSPQLVLLVGCFGLLFNILGLFLFHQHSHGHDEEQHNTRYSGDMAATEEGHGQFTKSSSPNERTVAIADPAGNVADVLPQAVTGAWSNGSPKRQNGLHFEIPNPGSSGRHTESLPTQADSSHLSRMASGGSRRHRRTGSSRTRRLTNVEEPSTTPFGVRAQVMKYGQPERRASEGSYGSEDEIPDANGTVRATESSPLLSGADQGMLKGSKSHMGQEERHDSWHTGHKHKSYQSGGHSHGDMNIRGIFLHVMGDALGNIGVIASALFIWLTDFTWRFYVDPAISLFITVIILSSAIPLCKAASRILLQAVPTGINVDDIKDDIEDLEGVISCHHVHVWGLDENKMVASLHVQADCDIREGGSAGYMELARKIRDCLHGFGIHSSTIQPEFVPRRDESNGNVNRPRGPSRQASRAGSVRSGERICLLECEEGCGDKKQCCVPSNAASDDEGHNH